MHFWKGGPKIRTGSYLDYICMCQLASLRQVDTILVYQERKYLVNLSIPQNSVAHSGQDDFKFGLLTDFFIGIIESETVRTLLLLLDPHLLLRLLRMRSYVSLHDVSLLKNAGKDGDVLVGELLRPRAR